MKKVQKLLISALCVALGTSALVACAGGGTDNTDANKVTVTFYDATGTTKPTEMKVLKTVTVEKGGTVESFEPTGADGYDFMGWFGTPTKSQKFDFSEEITEDKAIFAGFSRYVADTRDFYIIGSGKSSVLIDGWGHLTDSEGNYKENHKFTKAADKNEYTITLDLRKNDQFVLVTNEDYYNKHGAGYLTTMTLDNGTEVFQGKGSPYDDSFTGADIIVQYDGNYTLKLTTYPDDDYYNTAGEGYTEATKEIYARNPYDTIEWVRNGNCLEELEVVTDYYIKGEKITNWQDVYNPSTKMTSDNGVYTLSVYIEKDDKFMFTSTYTTPDDSVTTGAEYVYATALDEESKAYLDSNSGNMVAKASGTYTFKYTESTGVLTVTFEASTPVPTDYYIDGTFADGVADWSGYCFNNDYKMTETEAGSGIYSIKGVTMKADSQFIIQAFKEGSTERGEWGTEGYNGLGSYNYLYLYNGGASFSAVGGGNNNIKVLTAGTYDITFNSYMHTITIARPLDIYVKGTGLTNSADQASDWNTALDSAWKLSLSEDKSAYEITLTVESGAEFGFAAFDVGATSGYGDYLGAAALGTAGDANSSFKPESGTNFKSTVSGKYKIVYTIATGKIDIYAVPQA